MRTAFCNALIDLASSNDRIWLLTGDLGFSVLEPFAQKFPNRFVNVGVAEQNMMGVAAGLALANKIVFTYSIANFPIMRCLEQIRNDVCYHNLDVRIVSVGGGVVYGSLGYSHFGLEDLAVTRVLPNMTVIAPGDAVEVRLAMTAIAEHQGPVYLRLGKGREPIVHVHEPKFIIGKAITVREGNDLTFLTTGGILSAVFKAAEFLAQRGLSARVLSMHTLRPLDDEAVLKAAEETERLITVEEHGAGGLFSAVSEVLACHTYMSTLRGLNLAGEIPVKAGDQDSLLAQFGLDIEGIVTAAL